LLYTLTSALSTRTGNGSIARNNTNIVLLPCQESFFSSSQFGANAFYKYNLQTALCSPPDFNATINGTFLSNLHSFLNISVMPCDNISAQALGISCNSEEIITTAINSGDLLLELYYPNNNLDPTNYATPNQSYLDNLYWKISPSMAIYATIEMDATTIQSYDSYFFPNSFNTTDYFSIDPGLMREQSLILPNFSITNPNFPLVQIYFTRSQNDNFIIRVYANIIELLERLGGLLEIILAVCGLLTIGTLSYKHLVNVAREEYEIIDEEVEDNDDNEDLENSGNNLSKSFLSNQAAEALDKAKILQKEVRNHANKRKILKEHRCNCLRSICLFFRCMKRTKDDEVMAYGRKKAKEDINYYEILRKLKDVEILKSVLLNEEQKIFFSKFPQKMAILPKSQGSQIKTKSKKSEAKPLSSCERDKYIEMYKAYLQLKNNQGNEVNRKLIDTLGDYKALFEKFDLILQGNPDPIKTLKQYLDEIHVERPATIEISHFHE